MPANGRERIRDEKINGQIFDMSSAPNFRHSVVNGRMFSKISNIETVVQGELQNIVLRQVGRDHICA